MSRASSRLKQDSREQRDVQLSASDYGTVTDQINHHHKAEQHVESASSSAKTTVALAAQQTEGMVEMGGGLPALPPRPPVPQRQAQASVSSAFSNGKMEQRVPNVKQMIKPEFNIPAGSDLGIVGKIGAYQMAHNNKSHTSSATHIHANMVLWVYALLFVTFIMMKKRQ